MGEVAQFTHTGAPILPGMPRAVSLAVLAAREGFGVATRATTCLASRQSVRNIVVPALLAMGAQYFGVIHTPTDAMALSGGSSALITGIEELIEFKARTGETPDWKEFSTMAGRSIVFGSVSAGAVWASNIPSVNHILNGMADKILSTGEALWNTGGDVQKVAIDVGRVVGPHVKSSFEWSAERAEEISHLLRGLTESASSMTQVTTGHGGEGTAREVLKTVAEAKTPLLATQTLGQETNLLEMAHQWSLKALMPAITTGLVTGGLLHWWRTTPASS